MLYLFYYIKIITYILNQSPCFIYLQIISDNFYYYLLGLLDMNELEENPGSESLLCQENIYVMTLDTIILHFAPPLHVLENKWTDSPVISKAHVTSHVSGVHTSSPESRENSIWLTSQICKPNCEEHNLSHSQPWRF